jgi:hypothetical protein
MTSKKQNFLAQFQLSKNEMRKLRRKERHEQDRWETALLEAEAGYVSLFRPVLRKYLRLVGLAADLEMEESFSGEMIAQECIFIVEWVEELEKEVQRLERREWQCSKNEE